MEATTDIVLDHVLSIRFDRTAAAKHQNELRLLDSCAHGLHFLYQQVRAMELQEPFNTAEQFGIQFGADWRSMLPCAFPNLGCCFQWYSVTLQNYVELVGCIGKEIGGKPPEIRTYAKDVLGSVAAYRDNVGGHFGRAQTGTKRPNYATRFASLMPPSGFVSGRGIDGRYFTHMYRVVTRTSGMTSDSNALQPWSLTMKHEELASRYWPALCAITLLEQLAQELQDVSRLASSVEASLIEDH